MAYSIKEQQHLYVKAQKTLCKAETHPITEIKSKKARAEVACLEALPLKSFSETLQQHEQFPLQPIALDILQINVGYLCNQTCNHCHVNAGPSRRELMTEETMRNCLQALDKGTFHTVDLTGGAPEIHPKFRWFVSEIAKRDVTIIVRSNLTILTFHEDYAYLPKFFKKHRVQVIASLPCYTLENVDAQRGEGAFEASIKGLQLLNELGYGKEHTGLELHLVFNPLGPSLPGSQEALERDYKKMLFQNFGIVFNKLYTITNMPISRFLEDLKRDNKLEEYMMSLVEKFNLSAVANVMCRNTLSVRWDGTLFDCDFNQMLQLPIAGKNHINDFNADQLLQRSIVLNNHCYGCTAGAGSSCQGAISEE